MAVRWTKVKSNNPKTAKYNVSPLRISGVECFAYHDSRSGICCHPKKMHRMLQARNPNDVEFKTTVLTCIWGFSAG